MNYTLAQARAFTGAAARLDAQREASMEAATATALRMAWGANPNDFAAYLRKLT